MNNSHSTGKTFLFNSKPPNTPPPSPDVVNRLLDCMVKLQGQLDRLSKMHSDTILTMGKLGHAVVNLTEEVSKIKESVRKLEEKPSSSTSAVSGIKEGELFIDSLISESLVPSSSSSSSAYGKIGKYPDFLESTLIGTVNPSLFVSPPKYDVQRKLRVLVVEDDVSYQWLVSKHLQAKGIDCVLAGNAQDAFAKLPLFPSTTIPFDLILMDIHLPGGNDGLEVAQTIRSFDAFTPIVSMTSSVSPRQIATYLASGMNDVLPKPFTRDGLLDLVSRFCTLDLGPSHGTSGLKEIVTSDFLTSSIKDYKSN